MQDEEEEGTRVVERIIERPSNGNGSYNRLKDVVFTAIILAAGGIIWQQQEKIDAISIHLAQLDLKCEQKPVYRGGGSSDRP